MTVSGRNRDDLLTTGEAAALLNVSTQTVRRLRYDGDLAYVVFGYRTIRHRRGDLEQLVALRRVGGSHDALVDVAGGEQPPVGSDGGRRRDER